MFSNKSITLLFLLFLSVAANVCQIRPVLKLYSGYSSSSWLRDDVQGLQNILRSKGYSVSVDGYFGAQTASVVKSYQRANRLSADGIVGPQTWSSLCANAPSPPAGGSSCVARANPYGLAPKGSTSRWNPIAQHVVNEINRCFSGLQVAKPTTYIGSAKSDHPGNAMDLWPVRYGVAASGQALTNGWTMANWLQKNARTLKVRYVIWQDKIWSLNRPSDGWRRQYKSGVTYAHYDHIHVSVWSSTN